MHIGGLTLVFVGDLRVSTDGLADLATTCAEQAAIAEVGTPPSAHSTLRSTAAAVQNVHDVVAASGVRVVERLSWTSEQMTVASMRYDAIDAALAPTFAT